LNAPKEGEKEQKKIKIIFFAESKTSLTFAIPKRTGYPAARCQREMKNRKIETRIFQLHGRVYFGDNNTIAEPRGEAHKFF